MTIPNFRLPASWRPLVFRNILLGAGCGFLWFVVLFVGFAIRAYIQGQAGGMFYLAFLAFSLIDAAVATFWILPLLGAVAGLKWPISSLGTTHQQVPPGNNPLVILVHGTFAASKDDGGKAWWQTGGSLCDVLNAYGGFDYLPFHWSGANLESVRREASRALTGIIHHLEKEARPYHLVAHSHGGNVVWRALVTSVIHKRQLQHLKSWTTVGSPFFSCQTEGPRAGHLVSLAVLAVLFTASQSGLAFIWRKTNAMWSVFESFEGGLLAPILVDSMIIAAAATGVWLVIDFLLRLIGLIRDYRRRKAELATYRRYGHLHQALASSADEAINGLDAVSRLDSRVLRVVPPAPYLNKSAFGKLLSPLTFPFVSAWNLILHTPLNSWMCRLLQNKMQGNDVSRSRVASVSAAPLSRTVRGTLGNEEELELRERAAQAAGVSFGRTREALGIFAAGSSVSVALETMGPNASDALVHTSYFANQRVVGAILRNITGERELPNAAAVDGPLPASSGELLPVSRLGAAQAAAVCLALFVVWVLTVAIYRNNIVPRTTSARLEGLIQQNIPIAGFSHGPAARTWYAALCGTGHCGAAAVGYHFEISNEDNFETKLSFIRSQAACEHGHCDDRDQFIKWTMNELSGANPGRYQPDERARFENRIERWWIAASRITHLKRVPDVVSYGFKAVTEEAELNRFPAMFDRIRSGLAKSPDVPADLRSRLQYVYPLFSLTVSSAEFDSWDRGISPATRLDNKLRLAEAGSCRSDLDRGFIRYDNEEYPSETIERVASASQLWWGECSRHLAIVKTSLRAAERDYREFEGTRVATSDIAARYWIALAQARRDEEDRSGDEWNTWASHLETELQKKVEQAVLQQAATPGWFSVLPVLRKVHDRAVVSFSENFIAALQDNLIPHVASDPERLREMVEMCLAMTDPGKLKESLLAAMKKADLPASLDPVLVQFSEIIGPDSIEKLCWDARGEPGCALVSRLNYAWAMKAAARAAGVQTLRAAAKEEPVGFYGQKLAAMNLNAVFIEEGHLQTYLEGGLAQRLGTEATSEMYFQAARGMAAVGKFQQALRYFDRIATYDRRLIAATDILMQYEKLRREFQTTDLDFVADWGNRNWDDARKAWIRDHPSH